MPQGWDRFFHFPSEGKHAQDFSDARKIQRLRPGLNPRTRVPVASMLTTRPTKPLPKVTQYAYTPTPYAFTHWRWMSARGIPSTRKTSWLTLRFRRFNMLQNGSSFLNWVQCDMVPSVGCMKTQPLCTCPFCGEIHHQISCDTCRNLFARV